MSNNIEEKVPKEAAGKSSILINFETENGSNEDISVRTGTEDQNVQMNSLLTNSVKNDSKEASESPSNAVDSTSPTADECFYRILNEKNEQELVEFLKSLPNDVQSSLSERIAKANDSLAKENDAYDHVLNEDKFVQNALKMLKTDEKLDVVGETPLSYQGKCFFANKRLQQLEENLKQEKSSQMNNFKAMQFHLESLNLSLESLKESQEFFNKNVRIGGKHPVTKAVILQKVAKFFDDSTKSKAAMANRYQIQIQSDIMERNKLLSQIKEQQKRVSLLDLTKYEEAKSSVKKSRRTLHKLKDQLRKCKSRSSLVSSNLMEVKKYLESEQSVMQERQATISKKENMKNIMAHEKARNDERMEELKATMKKMTSDPRRHNLPGVTEYAEAKRDNEALKKKIKKWNQKVELAEQAKLMFLQKKSHSS